MATVPHIYELFPAAWTAAGVINALRAHISGTSTRLTLDADTPDEGLTIGFAAANQLQQVNLRKASSDTIAVSIEPSGSITDPGDSSPTAPTGTTADWSGAHNEPTFDVTWGTGGSPAAGSKLLLAEYEDAFLLIATNAAVDGSCWQLHAGRIVDPFNSSSSYTFGQDGLGFMAGVPDGGNGSGNDWVGTSAPCSSAHWATEEWSDHITWATVANINQSPALAHTNYAVLAPIVVAAYHINGSSSAPSLGPAKYIRVAPANAAPFNIWATTGSDQGFLVFNESSGTEIQCALWDKTWTV